MFRITFLIGLVLAGCVVAAPRTVRAQTADVTATVNMLHDATVAGDLDAVLGLYAADAVVVSPFGIFSGPAAIRGFYEGFLQQNSNLGVTFIDRQVALGTSEVHHSLVASDSIRAAGIERVQFIETIVVAQSRVRSATILLDLSDAQTAQFAAAQGSN